MEVPKADYWTLSDGSGYKDGYGGWAAMGCFPDGTYPIMRIGSASGTTVDRMEMTGMLEGLQIGYESYRRYWPDLSHQLRIALFSDRESIVNTINGLYGIHANEDLWARFQWYADRMSIVAIHLNEREQNNWPYFVELDLHASSARTVIKAYAEAINPESK